jgi:sulfate adenylyltransferase subunit 1
VVEQTRRHAAVAALLRVPHLVLAVNKMDLVGYAEPVFAATVEEFSAYAASLRIADLTAVPVSALAGDNVVEPSAHMAWYGGPTLLEHLETVPVGSDPSREPVRFPVQYVIRPQGPEHPHYRGYGGQLASGVLRTGDTVTVLPSGRTATVAGIDALGRATDIAWAPQSVTVRLAEELDVSRGDLLAAGPAPVPAREVTATVCHLHERPLRRGDRVLLKHTTRTVRAVVKEISHRIDIDTLERRGAAEGLGVNDIGHAVLRTAEPLVLDDYRDNRRTGSFLLVDPADGATLTAGMAEVA